MWAPILEKAWAKVKGSYEAAEGGFTVSGLRSLIGAPVFTYDVADIGTSNGLSLDDTFALLTEANNANYPMGAGTAGTSDSGRNDCGIATAHAYSILETFTMTDTSSVAHKMLLVRNPWGVTYYTGAWHKGDTNWTNALVAQVPLGIDPRTSDQQGIFAIPMSTFGNSGIDCIENYEIAHMRDSEGYKASWYDAENMDDQSHNYFVTVPANDGALYFTVETYYQEIVPNECSYGTFTYSGGSASRPNAVVNWAVYEDGSNSRIAYQFHSD